MTTSSRPAGRSSQLTIDSPRLLIRASAGTGKTFRLSSRYISLLRHASPEKILSSTFTRKAAGEILERILLRLARATVSTKSLQELAKSVGEPPLTRDDCLCMLKELTQQLHRVRISTLDSFFAQLAGSHALELGFPSGWRILDPVEVQQLRAQALEQMLHEGDQQELVQLMHMLDKGDSSRSVSGLMHQTIDDLYQVFVDSNEESWDRFPDHQFLSEEHRDELFQHLELLQVDQKQMQTAIANDLAAARSGRWDDFQGKGLLPKIRSGEPTYYRAPIPSQVCNYYLQLAEHCQAITSASWKQQTQAAWRLLSDFHQVFERLKLAAGGLEFGDVTRRLSSSQNAKNRQQVNFRMDGAIEHLLLDEFQDTSRPQWEVIRSFAEEACREPQRSFFCVGDTKQAIYGWRGGEAAIFDAIEQQLENLESQPLNVSYRSSPVVIDAVNQAMTRLKQHDNFEEHAALLHQWCNRFPAHETSRKDLTGYVCLRTGPEVPEGEDGPASGRQQREEFWNFAAKYVAELVTKSPEATVGILTRGNAAVGRMIFELTQLGIEASEEGGNPLTDSTGVQLVLSLMWLADHPGDSIAAFHVAQSPLGQSLGFQDYDDPLVRTEFSQELRSRLQDQGYGQFVHDLALRMAPVSNAREHRRLLQLAGLADQFDLLFPSLRPGDFVTYAQAQRCQEPTGAKVRVMNIHQSKGLEFDIVVLPELAGPLLMPPRYVTHSAAPGAAPDLVALYRADEYFTSLGGDLLEARTQTRNRALQEALCVLYVAMTRAAHSLHMLIPPKVHAKHPKTFAGLLCAALAPAVAIEPMKLLWECGDPNWDQATAAAPAKPETAAVPVQTGPALKFAPAHTPRHAKRTSPSKQKGESTGPFPASSNQSGLTGTERGLLVHRWLQEFQWLETTPLDLNRLKQLAHTSALSETELTEQLLQFEQQVQHPAIMKLLSEAAQSARREELATRSNVGIDRVQMQVRTEFPFLHRLDSAELMQGSMDRLVLFSINGKPVAADIVDFKTDNASTPAAVKQLTAYYRQQLLAYREAARRLFQIEPQDIRLFLTFIGNGHVQEVE